MKTLFVRPKKRVSSGTEKASFEPWKKFIDLFPNSKDGKANIKAFQDADIEVVLIGEPSNPYGPMRNLWYDPADDPNEPPCTIMELVLERYYYANGDPVVYPNDAHEGHTYLLHGYQGSWPYGEQVHTWNWSIPAYTYSNPLEDEYNFPTFYPYPLERYISEGTYEQIVKGQYPDMTDCSDGGSKCKKASPMNLPDDSLTPPFNKSKDQTVEFNAITFDADGTIKEMDTSQRGIPNTFHKVLAKLVVHEMGHGLLGAMIEDHCDNPCCIMYDRTKNWEQLGFGRNNACSDVCTHSPGYSKDISHYGVVYNIQPPKKP